MNPSEQPDGRMKWLLTVCEIRALAKEIQSGERDQTQGLADIILRADYLFEQTQNPSHVGLFHLHSDLEEKISMLAQIDCISPNRWIETQLENLVIQRMCLGDNFVFGYLDSISADNTSELSRCPLWMIMLLTEWLPLKNQPTCMMTCIDLNNQSYSQKLRKAMGSIWGTNN
jgi:hypothetical protein